MSAWMGDAAVLKSQLRVLVGSSSAPLRVPLRYQGFYWWSDED